jgi:predicted DCC family thiol-disulfide oxidoreductase YuxK
MSQIIFFDGVCVLCNGFVDFVIARDVERIFRFAPLQGERAKGTLPPSLHDLSTVVLWSQGQTFVRSDAALMVLQQLGGFWGLVRVFWVVPRPLRDLAYRLIASRRYFWFGKRESCRLPTAEERGRFLE